MNYKERLFIQIILVEFRHFPTDTFDLPLDLLLAWGRRWSSADRRQEPAGTSMGWWRRPAGAASGGEEEDLGDKRGDVGQVAVKIEKASGFLLQSFKYFRTGLWQCSSCQAALT